jgi:D-3-phosphoglycerate dehydrogenase
MKKVLVTEPIHADGLALLKEHVEVVQGKGTTTEEIIEQAKGCHGILIRSAKIPKEVMEATPTLEVVGKHGIGVDNIDVAHATDNNIMVVNAPESNVNAVAEHALALILEVSKNLRMLDMEVRKDNFKSRSAVVNMELRGKTAGLVGLGKISSLLAEKLLALGLKVVAYDPFVKVEVAEKMGVELSDLDNLLKVSDIVSLHVPLNDATAGMIGKAQFEMMKPSAFLINVARGPVVNEVELYDALKNNVIRGAGIDVFEVEPPQADNKLFELNNVTMSPHNAALTDEALIAMATHSARGIVDCLNGETPEWVVNRDVLK